MKSANALVLKILVITIMSLFLGNISKLHAQESTEAGIEIFTNAIDEKVEEMELIAQDLADETFETVYISSKSSYNPYDFGEDVDSLKLKMATPYMGVYTKEMTLKDVAKLGYNKTYGVLITGVSKNTPARLSRILANDILMEIDGEKVTGSENFTNLIKSHYVGETVDLKLFRNGKEMIMPFKFGMRPEDRRKFNVTTTLDGEKKYRPKKSVGHGGGSWIPVWFTPDLDDINNVLKQMSFSELKDDGLLMHGFGGKGNVGKGWFIGGMFAFHSQDNKTNFKILDGAKTYNTIRRMQLSVAYGGVTLDKRFAISRKFITSLGFMLGGGGYGIDVSQTYGDYDWNNLAGNLEDSRNNRMELSRSFILFQPKVMLMYRVNDWFGFRAEGGYMLSHSIHSGWGAENMDDEYYEIGNSPDTSFDGLTLSVGPWFGF